MLFESESTFVTIPYNISKYGIYSGQAILVGFFVSCYYRHYYLSIILFILYLTTMHYWRKIHHFSILKCLDVVLAFSAAFLLTFRYCHYFTPLCKKIWIIFAFILCSIFFINEYIYYNKCINKENTKSDGSLFSLKYVEENTLEREQEYYRAVLTHCALVHISPVFVYTFCCFSSM